MACIDRVPQHCDVSGSVDTEPLTKIGSIVGTIAGIAGVAGGVIKWLEANIAGLVASIGGAAGGGAIAGAAVAIALIVIIGMYIHDRCISKEGWRQCVAGVVHNIVQDFSDAVQELFPFTGMHDRIDVVLKSDYWDVVEYNTNRVFCTNETIRSRRTSAIMRSYYYTKRVCDAGKGALVGAIVGAVGGIIAAAAVAAAIGCATIVLCIFALLLAALVAAVAVLVGAFAGGQIAKAASGDTTPTDAAGNAISIGDLVTLQGNMIRKEYDEGANVLWWVNSTELSGRAPDSIPNNPFSYCEINDVFPMDSCRRG